MFVNQLIWLLVALLLAGCGKPKVEAVTPYDTPGEALGPFAMEFGDGNTYEKKISANIRADEGAIRFQIYANEGYQLIVEETKIAVENCSGPNVKFVLGYAPDMVNAPNDIYPISLGQRIAVASKARTAVVAIFQNISDCTHLDFTFKATKIPAANMTKGIWTSNYNSAIDPFHTLTIDVQQLTRQVVSYFDISCQSTQNEKFTAEMITSNEDALPRKMVFKITQVTSVGSPVCSKMFQVKSQDVGKKIYCIHNRAGTSTAFNLACRLEGTGAFPTSYDEVTTNWTRK